MRFLPGALILAASVVLSPVSAGADVASQAAPLMYTISVPEPVHRWLAVELLVRDVPNTPLALRMARSSPGRYATHDFARHVFDVTVTDERGTSLTVLRPSPHEWRVDHPPATVRVRYKVFGDRIDGTYLAVDATHAHINMPAALMYVNALADRPSIVQLVQPTGTAWRAATQLFPTSDPLRFTAPNLQYLMDSPIEFGDIAIRTFTVPTGRADERTTIRVAMHHRGSAELLDAYVREVERVVSAERDYMGELPVFEPGSYTFIVDALPWAHGDGMEHRNSTVITSSRDIESGMAGLVGTASHEFLHCWNVERIRPASLEPFNFDDTNISGELWLAEGFTSYIGRVLGMVTEPREVEARLRDLNGMATLLTVSPSRAFRSPKELSEYAAFEDGARWVDPMHSSIGYTSYYAVGASVALGLDLVLRDVSDGRLQLRDFMRALWRRFGATPPPSPGRVATPYTIEDLRAVVTDVTGDRALANRFFDRHVEGRDPIDFEALFARAGLVWQPVDGAGSSIGLVRVGERDGHVTVTELVEPDSPAARAGLEKDAVIESLGGRTVSGPSDLSDVLARTAPGSRLAVVYTLRGERSERELITARTPTRTLVPFERAGRAVTPGMRRIRAGLLPETIQ